MTRPFFVSTVLAFATAVSGLVTFAQQNKPQEKPPLESEFEPGL